MGASGGSSGAVAGGPPAGFGLPGPGDVVEGKYEIVDLVGQGGMGVVLSARHTQLGQTVALKLIRPDAATSEDVVRRFLREARAAASIESDHVVRIYDVGTLEGGAPFMVMELLRGIDLGAFLDQSGTLAVDRAVDYVLQACSAIEAAHQRGVVHRDLKPSNLFLTRRSNGSALVKVLDFGISKAIDPEGAARVDLTSTSTLVGSPQYMAPEQIRNARSVDSRADIWALGALLHEMLAGRPPFEADNVPAMCAAIAADPPEHVRDFRPEVPEALEIVILRCLEKDPARRFQTVAELMAALRPFSPQEVASQPTWPAPPMPSAPDVTMRSGIEQQPTLALDSAQIQIREAQAPRVELVQSAAPISKTPSRAPAQRRGALAFGVLTIGVVAAASWLVVHREEARPVAVPAAHAGFALSIDSTPAGAAVFDGDRQLGTTPLVIRLSNADLAAPRRFTLRLAGYLPYDVVQGASQANVRVLASLAAAPAPPPSATATPEPPPSAPAVAPRPRPRPAPAPARPKPTTTTPDIWMHR